MLAHWWFELDPVPLVGRAISKFVFRGGTELSMALDNLSADGWGCVTILLIVWPEVFQHQSLQDIRYGV